MERIDITNPIAYVLHHWWLWVLRGFAAIIFGILTLAWPGMSLLVLVILFGAYALWDGAFAVISALAGHSKLEHPWLLGIEGLISIAAGVTAFTYPGITALALLYIIAIWALVTGLLAIGAAIRWRKVIPHTWLAILGGVASVAFGIVALAYPGAGALTVIWLIGTYAIVVGVLVMSFGLRLRSLRDMAPEK